MGKLRRKTSRTDRRWAAGLQKVVRASYNFPRRVPVTEIYSAISGNFRIACTDGAGQSSIEVAAVHSGMLGRRTSSVNSISPSLS